MITYVKTILFTNESRASPNDTDGLTKGWVFNGDNYAVGIRRQQSGSVVMILIFVKNYSACCSRHSVYVFFNRFISRIENKFKPPLSDRGFLFEGFFQKSLNFHLFLSSHNDLFFQHLIHLF